LNLLAKDGSYLANKVVSNGKIGFGITAVDYDNDSGIAMGFISYKPI
jgi:hypothetical protein